MSLLNVKLQTPEKVCYEGSADVVTLQTEVGEMQILPGHISFAGAIDFSRIVITHDSKDETFVVRMGIVFVDVETNTVRVAVEYGEKEKEMDHMTMKEYLNFILEKLTNNESLNDFQLKHLHDEKASLEKMLDVQV